MQDSQATSSVLSDLASGAAERVREPSLSEQEVVDLFDQFRDRLFRYVLTFGLPVEDCEEVIQETFLALFRHLTRGRSRRNLRGWLFRVAHNLALRMRLRARRDGHASATKDARVDAREDAAIDPAPDPERQFESAQTRARLLAVFRALAEQDRRCLSLRAEGLRYREIAGVLDMSLGSVSVSLARSLARLTRAGER
ncbi:MAG TPA: sigma-70 family RNA polymerase sigma factor [Bryobacteraceae bacterium]|nr:sigma-70 family RNA polymerase sigma factor [Bryobacteraceae bacterium]